jgi:putative Mg2+ transporter-C (MgtC) family protein
VTGEGCHAEAANAAEADLLFLARLLQSSEAMMQEFLDELVAGWPDAHQAARVVIRLTFAALLGSLIGMEREHAGKSAGVKTHMLVALATALFVVASLEAGMAEAEVSRVIQGLAAGIGFIGAGAILKRADEHEITGLTTAATVWMTAAIGVAVGLGRWGSAAVSVVMTLLILFAVARLTTPIDKH